MRPSLLLASVISTVLAGPAVAHAGTRTIDFNAFACAGGGLQVIDSPYVTQGFRFSASAPSGGVGQFISVCSGSPYYAGVPMFASIYVAPTVGVQAINGDPFTVRSVDIASNIYQPYQTAVAQTFFGVFADGTVIRNDCPYAWTLTVYHCTLPSTFTDLSAFGIGGGPEGVQFTDLVIDTRVEGPTTSTPEPATLTLVGAALVGLGTVARQRARRN